MPYRGAHRAPRTAPSPQPTLKPLRIMCGAPRRYASAKVPWYQGTLVPGYLGTQVPWYQGTLVPGYLGTQVPWYQGTLVPRYLGFFQKLRIAARTAVAPQV